MKNHVTVGVYPNGSYKVNIVRPEHLEGRIEYNRVYRPGRFFFVDGKYVFGGCFKKEKQEEFVKEWETKIADMNINSSVPSDTYW